MPANEIFATLYNDKGAVAGKNMMRTPEVNTWFRSIHVDGATTTGIWKLKLESPSDRELETIPETWKNAVK